VPILDSMPGLQRGVPLVEPSENGDSPRIELVRGDGHRPGFRIYTCGELEQLAPPAWLIERHLPLGGFAALYGATGSAKSFLAIAWALTVAAAGPGDAPTWLGWRAWFGPVVYIAAEGGTGLVPRIRAYRDAHQLADEPALYVIREPVHLGERVDTLLADVQAALPVWPSLVVIDTLARCLGGGDENSPEAMGGAVLAIDRIRNVTGAAVLVVHHTGRNGEKPRGHSSLDAAVDSMFYIKEEGGVRLLECTKQRDAEPVPIQRLRLVPQGASCVIEPVEGEVVGLSATDRRLLQAHKEVSLDGETNSTAWLDSSGVSKATYHRSLKRLIEGGFVRKRARRYSLTPLGEAECLKVSR
jgi:AAA domain-containing protein